MFTRLVVPLDGTREANIAVPHALRMARVSGGAVTLLRVVSHARDTAEAQTFLDDVQRQYAAPDLTIDTAVREGGDAAAAILAEVKQRDANLVVMRTRGRSGLTRAVLGSVAEKVVRQSPTPVLLLPPADQSEASDSITSMLVPVDGSPGGSLALGIAGELARQSHASLQLLQVIQPVPPYQSSAMLMYGPMELDSAWNEDAVSAAEAHVHALANRLTGRGQVARGEALMANEVPEAIIANAVEHGCDLIVMSSHAHTGAARAFIGSVTDAVVRSAKCPVLVIRREPESDAE